MKVQKRGLPIIFLVATIILMIFGTASSALALPIIACGTISTSGDYQVTLNVVSLATCFDITASDVSVDCQNNRIDYATTSSGFAFSVHNQTNITIKNCVMENTNQTDSHAINMTRINHALIQNNSMTVDGSNSKGIQLSVINANLSIDDNRITTTGSGNFKTGMQIIGMTFSNITTNTVIVNGSGVGSNGIDLLLGNSDNQIINNTVQAQNIGLELSLTSDRNLILNNTIHSDTSNGLHCVFSSNNNRIISNRITVNGSGFGNGLELNTCLNTTVENNDIVTTGAGNNFGIEIAALSHNNRIANNRIRTLGDTTNNIGINVTSSVNNTIVNNTINASGTSGSHGIELVGGSNNTVIANNTIQSHGNGQSGIFISGSVSSVTNTRIEGNTILSTGNTTNNGIQFTTSVFNSSISGNTIRTIAGTGLQAGIFLTSTVTGINITNNMIDVFTNNTGSTTRGIYLLTSVNNIRISGNIVQAQTTSFTAAPALELNFASDNTITSNTFFTNGTVSNSTPAVLIGTLSGNNTLFNNIIVMEATDAGSGQNGLEITSSNANNVSFNNIGTSGPSSNEGIVMTSSMFNRFVGNTVTTNGTGSNNFGIEFNTGSNNLIMDNIVRARGVNTNDGLHMNTGPNNNNTVINNIINALGTNNTNNALDCTSCNSNLFSNNTFNATGRTLNTAMYFLDSSNNMITRNNIFSQGGNFSVGMELIGSVDGTVQNNTIDSNLIITNGTGVSPITGDNTGVIITRVENTTFINNMVRTGNASATDNIGIMTLSSDDSRYWHNVVITTGTSINNAITHSSGTRISIINNTVTTIATASNSAGIRCGSAGTHWIIENNTVTTSGSDNAWGILVDGVCNNVTVRNNNIRTIGGTGNSFGILLDGSRNTTVINNNIFTNGTNSDGIRLRFGTLTSNFSNNVIVARGARSYGISISDSNFSTFQNTFLNDTTEWILTVNSTNATFTNTTFFTPNTTVYFSGRLNSTSNSNVSRRMFNPRFNTVFMNSTVLAFMNTTAQITFRNNPFSNPRPIVDFEDDGTFADCAGLTCTNMLLVGTTFSFDVSHFSNHSTAQIRNASSINVSFSPSSNVNFGTPVTTTCTQLIGDTGANITLTKNGVLINNGTSPISNVTNDLPGTYNYTCTYPETTNFFNSTSSALLVITDVVPPSITLNSPSNNTVFGVAGIINFTWTAIDDTDTSFSCDLIINGTTNQTGIPTTNNTATTTSVTSFSDGTQSWQITCTDGSANTNTSTPFFFTIDTTGPVITNINEFVTNTTAIINWTTDELSNTTLQYGLTTALGTFTGSDLDVLFHQATASPLNVNTTYFYNVSSCDTANRCSTEGPFNFTTLENNVAPIILNVAVTGITISTGTISVTTNEATNTTIFYGTSPSLGSTSTQTAYNTNNIITLSFLSQNTTYFFNVTVCDNASPLTSACVSQGGFNFTTSVNPTINPSGAGRDGAMFSITFFTLLATFALFALPFILKRFSKNDCLDIILKRLCWVLGLWLLTIISSIMMQFSVATQLGVEREMLLFIQFFGYAAYLLMGYTVLKTGLDCYGIFQINKKNKLDDRTGVER